MVRDAGLCGGGTRRRLWRGALTLLLGAMAGSPTVTKAKNVLVIGTHPDDEVLMAAGRSRTALLNGDTIHIVIVTNGDANGVAVGLEREGQSVNSAVVLGLTEQNVIFMGYPDSSLKDIHDAPTDTTVITSLAGQTATYGERGLGGMEYHRLLYGVHGPYTRATARGDFETLLADFQPDEIYTHSDFENHPDHQATALFVEEALTALKRQGMNLHTKLYQTIVWMPGDSWPWPQIDEAGWTPDVPFLPFSSPCTPGQCLDETAMQWSKLIHFSQPAEMLDPEPGSNLKALAVPTGPGWFGAFARLDEFFWLKDYGVNMATTATVTASSQDAANGLAAINAVDGVIKGYPLEVGYEWATQGELAGAWIQLSWPSPVRIAQVNLWDRPNVGDNILAGTLSFGDGSHVSVGALPANGRVMPVLFAPKTVSWVRFTVDQGEGNAVGLSEIQVLGAPASSTANVPPYFVDGPWPVTDTIPASQTTTVSVLANDVDGDALTYQWTTDGGFITGTGSTVLYTPPAVSAPTYFTVRVTGSDGQGGSATNSTYLRVTPAPTSSISVSPALLFGGDPATGSVVLGSAAPSGGTVVPLSSSQPSLVGVPASITVPAGATGATFPVTTGAVSANTTVTVTAAFGGGSRSATLTLVPDSVSLLSLSPANVLGGLSSQGTVTLAAPAGPSGAVVQLTSSDPTRASVPASVTVPAGATSASFVVTTASVGSAVNVSLSAIYGTAATATLTVSPAAVSSVSLNPASVVGGESATGTVLLNGPAPSGGAVVTLTSSASSTAAVPASVTVAAGTLSATFTVSTVAVTTSTAVAIGATYGAGTVTAALTVTPFVAPPPNPNLLTNPEQIGGAGWDVWGNLTVTLNAAAAPDGSQHASRAVSNGAGHALRQLVVGLSASTTYTLSFFARNNGGTAASYSVYDDNHGQDIVAPTSYMSRLTGPGFTRISVTFTTPVGCTAVGVYPVRDSGAPVDVLLWGAKLELGSTATGYQNLGTESLSVSPASVVSGATAMGAVTLSSAAPSGGTLVALSSSSSAVSVPASVTVPAGATGVAFSLATGLVTTSTTATISAVLPGGTRTASLTVTPLTVTALAVSPTTVVGGAGVTGTVTLGGAAPAGGATVTLASDDTSLASVPASVTVAAGATTATFAVTTLPTDPGGTAHLSATLGSSTATAALAVRAPTVSGLSVSPASVLGGASAVGTVTLTGAAAFGGVTVALGSSSLAVIVPTTVTVPGGATSATFTVSTISVTSAVTATLSATYGTTATASLAVGPLSVSSLTLSPGTLVGGASSTGTVQLNGAAPAGGAAVSLTSSAPATAAVPASVTVPAGALSATFSITTVAVTSATSVTVGAIYGGATVSAALAVNPAVQPPSNPNLLTSPEQIGGAGWDVWGNLAVTLNYAAAPDTSQHASRAVSNGNGHALRQLAFGLTPGATYTFSFFARNNGGTAASYSVYDDDHGQEIVAPTSYFAQVGSSGFTRVVLTFTTPAGCRTVGVYPVRDSGAPVDILLWGAKLEVGSTATGY